VTAMSKVTNGATLRHSRVWDMITFIASFDDIGVTLTQIQAYMLANHGLKFQTTAQYVYECRLAGFLTERDGLWHVTEKQRKSLLKKVA